MPKPELLFLSHLLPYPPDSGAAIRTFNTLRQLAQDFSITGLCFYRQDPAAETMSLADRLDHLSQFGSWRAIPIPQQESRVRLVADHLRSILTARPYTWYMHDSGKFERELRAALARSYALVHLDSLDLVRYAPLVAGLPLTCTHHNVESSLLRRRARGSHNPVLRRYLGLQARFLEGVERHWLPRMSLNIAVSSEDLAELSKLNPQAKLALIPNGVDTDYFSPTDSAGPGAVFVGGTNWFPNRDALQWFVSEVLPLLRERGYRDSITWVGFCTPEERHRYAGIAGFTLTGYVADVRPYISAAACFIVPLRMGGGTRLKVLDAWSMGKAVVSSRIGCEGLAVEAGENILIADTPEEFTDAILRVTGDTSLRNHLGAQARRTVEQRYAWDVIGAELRSLYSQLINQRRSSPSLAPVAEG